MGNHEPTYYKTDAILPVHYAHCTCGHYTEKLASKQAAEDQYRKHLEWIERVRAYLGTKTPSLKQQRDYYRDMAEHGTEKDRPLWKQLAEELSVRLGDKAPKWEQPSLIDSP